MFKGDGEVCVVVEAIHTSNIEMSELEIGLTVRVGFPSMTASSFLRPSTDCACCLFFVSIDSDMLK